MSVLSTFPFSGFLLADQPLDVIHSFGISGSHTSREPISHGPSIYSTQCVFQSTHVASTACSV